MNLLFIYVSASDVENSFHAKLNEFRRLDREIADYYDTVIDDWLKEKTIPVLAAYGLKNIKQCSANRDLVLALMIARAKHLLKEMDVL